MESIFGKRGGAKQSYVTSHYLLISISSTDVALTVLRTHMCESFVRIRDFCTFHFFKENAQWLLTTSLKGAWS